MKTLLTDDAVAARDVASRRTTPGPTSAAAAWTKYGRRDRGGVVGLGDLRPAGRESLQRVPMLEPLRGTKAHVGDAARPLRDTAAELVAALTGR